MLRRTYNALVYWWSFTRRIDELHFIIPEAWCYPTGSRYVCDPPVLDTDIDILVYSPINIDFTLTTLGYTTTCNEAYVEALGFAAWRKGKVNLIVSNNKDFIERFRIATHWCKRKNVKIKYHRSYIHEVIRHDEFDRSYVPDDLDNEIRQFLASVASPHGKTILKLYKVKHNLGVAQPG